jgi:thiol-disulfide isomerase/thioredoxin
MMKKSWTFLFLLTILFSLEAWSKVIETGPWRFELKTTHAVIPFNVEITHGPNGYEGKIFNGEETIILDEIIVDEQNKTVSIPLQTYELSLDLNVVDPKLLMGSLVRHNKNPKIYTRVRGTHGKEERFPGKKTKPTIDLNGKWALTLTDPSGKPSEGVGQFTQKDNSFSGAILTPTGDYRYLEGYVSGNTFEAASFDGVYNYIFRGSVKDKKMEAEIASNSKTQVTGKKDKTAKLPDAYSQTKIDKMKFIFPNLKGEMVSLNHDKFLNKPVIIQIFGSWCPNCLDEMNYLIPWYKENSKRGIEVIALAFERSLDPDHAKKQLLKVQIKKDLPYTLLLAGATSNDKPADKIKGLKNFISFPTTIFLNKKHEVVKVHAGFSGPSTGEVIMLSFLEVDYSSSTGNSDSEVFIPGVGRMPSGEFPDSEYAAAAPCL